MGHKDKLAIIPKQIDQETVDAVQELLSKALAGDIIGLAYATLSTHGQYELGATGTVLDQPERGIGVVSLLNTELSSRVIKGPE